MKSSDSMHHVLVTKQDLSLQSLTSVSLQEKLSSVNTITEISLVSNNIEDASCLSRYPMLRKVNIIRNPLKDIRWVEQLPQLEELEISSTDVSDLTPLMYLPNLRKLSASSTQIKNINPISFCKKLEILYLSDNDLPDDLKPLSCLDNLKELHISAVDKLKAQTLLSLTSLLSLEILDVDEEYRSTRNYIMMVRREHQSTANKYSPSTAIHQTEREYESTSVSLSPPIIIPKPASEKSRITNIEISPSKIIIILPTGESKRYNSHSEIDQLLDKHKNGFYQIHEVRDDCLIIRLKKMEADYYNSYRILLQFNFKSRTNRAHKITNQKQRLRMMREFYNEINTGFWRQLINISANLDYYSVIDMITCNMAIFTGLIKAEKKELREYSYLSNLYWSDFELLGKLTYVKENERNIPYYHVALVLLLPDILNELSGVRNLYLMARDIENRKKDKNFTDYKFKTFIENKALVDEIIAYEASLKNESSNTRHQKMQEFLKMKNLLLNFPKIELLCRAVKSYQSLLLIKSLISKLRVIKSPFTLLQRESVLNLFCLIGEHVTNKRLSGYLKSLQPHINWNKYVDFRDFIEHQVEKGCRSYINRFNLEAMICDLNLLYDSVEHILNRATPENIVMEVVNNHDNPPAVIKAAQIGLKLIERHLADIPPVTLKTFCQGNVPLTEANFKIVLNKMRDLTCYKQHVAAILQLFSHQQVVVESNKRFATLLKLSSDQIKTPVLSFRLAFEELTRNNRIALSLMNFMSDFETDLNNAMYNTVKEYFPGNNPSKKDIKLFNEEIFIDEARVKNLLNLIDSALVIFNAAKTKQEDIIYQRYINWAKNKDVWQPNMRRFVLMLKDNELLGIFEPHAINDTYPTVQEMQPCRTRLLSQSNSSEDRIFIVDTILTVCQAKPISSAVKQMKRLARCIQLWPATLTIENKIKAALIYLNRIQVILHDKLHDEQFMIRVFKMIREHRFSGFAKGYTNLTDQDMHVLTRIYNQAGHQDPRLLPENIMDICVKEYTESGLYQKLESASQDGEQRNAHEVVTEYIKVYETKINEELRKDFEFDHALRYNMKLAIILLHDISKHPKIELTKFLKASFQDLIAHRNSLAHDDDYIAQILGFNSSVHVASIGRTIYIITYELQSMSNAITKERSSRAIFGDKDPGISELIASKIFSFCTDNKSLKSFALVSKFWSRINKPIADAQAKIVKTDSALPSLAPK
jgi:hypothetical protein